MSPEPVDDAVANQALDHLLSARRSVRAFKEGSLDREHVEAIIGAGILAPFAEASVGHRTNFRRFFVFPHGSPALGALAALVSERAGAQLEALRGKVPPDAPFLKKLLAAANGTLPGIGDSPVLVVVAELKGTPPVEQQSLAHCLENMWLKATALGIGFHLVSALSMLVGDPRFAELLGLPATAFEYNGCALGFPAVVPPATPRPSVQEATRWMG